MDKYTGRKRFQKCDLRLAEGHCFDTFCAINSKNYVLIIIKSFWLISSV